MEAKPHLDFDGRCEEAVEFYRSALGAEVTMRFGMVADRFGVSWKIHVAS